MQEIYNISMIISIFTFALTASITPGPNNIMLLSSGLTFGYKRTIPHTLGIIFGFPLMCVLIGLGLGVVFKSFPLILTILKYIGIAYLLWMAYKIATNKSAYEVEQKSKPFTFLQAAMFQWVNPKAWIMAVTAISVYVTSTTNSIMQVLILTFIFFLSSIISTNTWSLGGVVLKKIIKNPVYIHYINILLAVLLVLTIFPVILEK